MEEEILTLALDIGEHMIICGAEISRVENTVIHICSAYDLRRINAFSLTSFIAVTVLTKEDKMLTQTRRVYDYSTNLGRLEELNALSRYISSHKPAPQEIRELLANIPMENEDKPIRRILGFICAASSFTYFFGGNMHDVFACGIAACFMYFIDRMLHLPGMNQMLYTVIASILTGCIDILMVHLGIGSQVDKIMIGNIMLLIPGLHLTNSIRDMMSGDIFSGLARLAESLFIALAIALGFAVSLKLLGGFL